MSHPHKRHNNHNNNSSKHNNSSSGSKHKSNAFMKGKEGEDSWSSDSLSDFKQDQQLLSDYKTKMSNQITSRSLDKAYLILDGSLLEGGGQVLRNGTSLACLLRLPFEISNIRANRPSGGGLKSQHLTGVRLANDISCGSITRGDAIGCTEIELLPSKSKPNWSKNNHGDKLVYEADIGTAGATGLLIQVALPIALYMPYSCNIKLKGGTDASFAPLFDYTNAILIHTLNTHFRLNITLELLQRGFCPKGGGEVNLNTNPVGELNAINILERGNIVSFHAIPIITSHSDKSVGDRMIFGATSVLKKSAYSGVNILNEMKHEPIEKSRNSGWSFILFAKTSTGCILGSSAIGSKNSNYEEMGESAAKSLVSNLESYCCVDEYLQDQLIIFMALAKGVSKIRTGPLTLHTRTAIFWAQLITGCKVNVTAAPDIVEKQRYKSFIIEVEGVGYKSLFEKAE